MLVGGGDLGYPMVGQRRERVESGSHGKLGARVIDECQIDGRPARMGRTAPGIGKKLRVRRVSPHQPLRFRWSKRVKDLEAVAERPRECDGPLQSVGRFRQQIAGGAPIDRLAGEIVSRGIADVEHNVMAFRADLDQFHRNAIRSLHRPPVLSRPDHRRVPSRPFDCSGSANP